MSKDAYSHSVDIRGSETETIVWDFVLVPN